MTTYPLNKIRLVILLTGKYNLLELKQQFNDNLIQNNIERGFNFGKNREKKQMY